MENRNNVAQANSAIVHGASSILSFVFLLLFFYYFSQPPASFLLFFLINSPLCTHVHIYFPPLSKSLLHYSLLSSLHSGFVSQLSHIPVPPSLASPGVRIQTLLHSCPPSFLASTFFPAVQSQISLSALLLPLSLALWPFSPARG